MFLSTKFIIEGFNNFKDPLTSEQLEHHARMVKWFINFETSQIDKPTIVVDEKEKAVVLYTNDALWEVVHKWQNKQLDNMSMIDGIKLWKEIKTLMEKDKL
jgi:ABC-type bacteriocin/lantibiotic exporter with double-glycine peptidase domain